MNMMNKLVREGRFNSRSACVRTAIREFLQREIIFEKYYKENIIEAEDILIRALTDHKSNKIILNGKEYTILGEA